MKCPRCGRGNLESGPYRTKHIDTTIIYCQVCGYYRDDVTIEPADLDFDSRNDAIVKLHLFGVSQKSLSEAFGITVQRVSQILKNRRGEEAAYNDPCN